MKTSILILSLVVTSVCLTSCGDPSDEVINVSVNLESKVPVRVGDFKWEKLKGIWTAEGEIGGRRCRLFPDEPSDYKAIVKYMESEL
jgi:hypothetical protein